ncbi:probable E3 ubiquitin-protein ligase ATL44 [Miscanthus floridulus]|uniref:probable E3 ubiquitin-protein ligase ATL44 n=1 Tax=Miscanthus floridulus TaxID=154761 RepID=UPI00345AD459
MRTPAGLLHSAISDTPSPAASLPLLLHAHAEEQQQQQAISVDSNTVVILASLLCALICVAGLALVARCACRRGGGGASVSLVASSGGNSSGGRSSAQPPRGLEKAAIEALPTVSVSSSLNKLKGRTREDDKECAICLAGFAEGDQLRVLPRCAHGFHAACIDTWLAAHASCPSCRATIVVSVISPSPPPLCRRCGAACCDLQDAMAAPETAAAVGLLTPWPIDGASLSSSTSIH